MKNLLLAVLLLLSTWLSASGPDDRKVTDPKSVSSAQNGRAAPVVIEDLFYTRRINGAAWSPSGGEIAYTARVFGPTASFATGWMMMLAYLIVCPWEAVAIGRLAAYLVPGLDTLELYRVAGNPVFLPRLVLGLLLTALITLINHRGIRLSATFQTWMTFVLLAMFVGFAAASAGRGSLQNLKPGFSHGPVLSVLLVLQIVPYFMTGFESVPKCAEEAAPEFRSRGFFRAILLALVVGILFYTSVVALVSYLRPWQGLAKEKFATAVAFEQAFGGRLVVRLLFLAALVSLVKIFNGNLVAASRLLFALGRAGLVHGGFGRVHERNLTPSVAVLALGGVTAVAACLGDAILVPITEVGSMASALGWLAACAAFFCLRRAAGDRALAVVGMIVAAALVLMKLLPFVPGHFTPHEWVALLAWGMIGLAARRSGTSVNRHPSVVKN